MATSGANPRIRTDPNQDAHANYPCPRTIHVRAQSAPAIAVTRRPHPRPGTVIDSRHQLSANSPQSRTVHVSELVTDRDSLRTATGNEFSAPAHSRFHLVAITFPSSYPNHFFVCPHLIQPQFAKRLMNSRRGVRRSSRICFRRRMSSLSCGRSARRIGPLPICSRNIVCRRARRPLPYSAIKCSAKSFGLEDGQGESVRQLPYKGMAGTRPLSQPEETAMAHRQNRP